MPPTKSGSWHEAIHRLEHRAGGMHLAARILEVVLGLIALLLFAIFRHSWGSLAAAFAFIVLFVVLMSAKAWLILRWRSVLGNPQTASRVTELIGLGPEYLEGLFDQTPGWLQWMVGRHPHSFSDAALFIAGHLRWFLEKHPQSNRAVYGFLTVILMLVFWVIARIYIRLTGMDQQYLYAAEGLYVGAGAILLNIFVFWALYLIDRQIAAYRRVSQIIRDLSPDE